MASSLRFISQEEVAYIDLLLRDSDADSRKKGLQRLCEHYRRGNAIVNPVAIRTFVLGMLNDESEKVVRWALNTLALLGSRRDATPIQRSIDEFRSSPDLLGAAISALSVLLPPEEFSKALIKSELPLEGSILFAAAQQNSSFIPRLKNGRIDIESASPVDLRMATILVGLNKAPFRLFSPKYTNAAMIGQLNLHDDPLVAQYSVWAAVENPHFGLKQLALPLSDVEAQPENVRGWVYRLIADDPETAAAYVDIIRAASTDGVVPPRRGLAEGLSQIAFEGVDDIVLAWILRESNEEVRQHLLEHMARFADQFTRYVDMVVAVYRNAGRNSILRARLEAAARGTKLYTTLKIIDLDAERTDLFALAPPSAVDQHRPYVSSMPIPSTEATAPAAPASLPAPDEPRVLIVVALAKELAAVLAAMSRYKKVGAESDPNIYYVGEFADPAEVNAQRSVLVCQSGMGNNNAATTASNALRSFRQIQHIIMCGIAGGCPNPDVPDEHVRLGDIVYSNAAGILEYDSVKEDESGRTIRSAPQLPSNRMLSAADAMMAESLLDRRPWEGELDAIIAKQVNFRRPSDELDVLYDVNGDKIEHPPETDRAAKPRVFGGGIGTADTLQKSPKLRDHLRDKYRVRAIEMEAGGIQNAAWAAGHDIIVVRGICDYCDNNKSDTWQMYASAAAASFTKRLVLELPNEWF